MFIHNSFQIIYKCEFVWSVSCYFFFWDSCSNHRLAALDRGAGVEQPFGCLIVQNRQAMQSIRRSMDWTLEDNMVDGLFFCATLTARRGSHAPFVQAGAETSNTGVEAVKPDCPPTPQSIDDPPTAPHVCCCCQMRCAACTNGCLDLNRRVSALDGRASAEWSRCPDSTARRAGDSVAALRRSSAGWMPARVGRLSAGVRRRHPVTIRKASLMAGSMRRVWSLRQQTWVLSV